MAIAKDAHHQDIFIASLFVAQSWLIRYSQIVTFIKAIQTSYAPRRFQNVQHVLKKYSYTYENSIHQEICIYIFI